MLSVDELIYRWRIRLTVFSVGVILAVTLFPYVFFFNQAARSVYDASLVRYGGRKHVAPAADPQSVRGDEEPEDWLDLPVNILLFVPLGFGLACLTTKRGLGKLTGVLVIVTAGFCLSLSVEILQLFVPSRFSSVADILTNVLGTLLGLLIFRLWRFKILEWVLILRQKIRQLLTIKVLIASVLAYVALSFLMSITLQRATSLTNWDDTFPLLLGNEQTGNRPWRGYVDQLQITNRAISKNEVAQAFAAKGKLAMTGPLLCWYQWSNGGSYRDRTGHLPELVWKGESQNNQEDKNLFGPGRWLETTHASSLTQELRKTSQFTLSATLATANTVQSGPARIISLSADPYRRNFTLGQQGSHLVFRLRTPLTGENGMKPELIVPNVFANLDPHYLVITYDGSELHLYIDGVQQSQFLELTPGATFFNHLFRLDFRQMTGYKIAYYGLIFIPLSFLSVFIIKRMTCRVFIQLLVVGILLMSPFVLEYILMSVSGKLMNNENLLFGVAFIAGSLLWCSPVDRLRRVGDRRSDKKWHLQARESKQINETWE